MVKINTLLKGAVPVLVASVATAPAVAQVAPLAPDTKSSPLATSDQGDGLQSDIVVTAQKRSESLQRVPAAITALGSTALQQRGITDTDGLKFAAPSLQVGVLGGNTNIAIRGVGLNLVATSAPPAVAVHVDGVYQPITALGDLAQVDLERVEVLRGPQGTLYGRNANAGAINFITKAPTNRFEGYLQAGYATYNESRLQGMINIPISGDVRIRGVVDWRDRRDGFIKSILPGGQDLDKSNTLSGRVSLSAAVTSNLKLDITAMQLHSSGPTYYFSLRTPPTADAQTRNPFLVGALTTGEPWRTAINDPVGSSRDYTFVATTLAWQLGGVQVKSITGYQHLSDFFMGDDDATNKSAFLVTREYHDRTITQEINLGAALGPANFILGGFYMDENYTSHLHTNFPTGIFPLGPNSQQDFVESPLVTRSLAGFGDVTLNLSTSLRLLGGLRYSHDVIRDTQVQYLVIGPSTAQTFNCPLQTNEVTFNSTTPRVGAQFDVSGQSNLYASFSKGFKDGGFSRSQCNKQYQPEKITAYEIGMKNKLFNNTMTANVSAFYYDYTDLQLSQQVGLSQRITNAASSRVMGAEIEINWQPDRHWNANASLSLLDAKYIAFSNVDVLNPTLGVQDVSGKYLNNAPVESTNLGIAYRTSELKFGHLTFRADISHRSRYYFREFNAPLDGQGAYAILNLGLIWDGPDDKYRVRIYGTNVTNQAYINTLSSADAFGSRYLTWGAPSQFGAEFRVAF